MSKSACACVIRRPSSSTCPSSISLIASFTVFWLSSPSAYCTFFSLSPSANGKALLRSVRILIVSFCPLRSENTQCNVSLILKFFTSTSSASKVISTGCTPKAQAWSRRPQRLLVRSSPQYAMFISPIVLRLRLYIKLNALATSTQIAAEDDSPLFIGNVILVIVIFTPPTLYHSSIYDATPAQ